MDTHPPSGVMEAPSPWLNIPISIWLLPFVSKTPLLEDAYAPLEAGSAFAAEDKSGGFKGGLGTLQVLRYHDTPVGPYDEILIVPGRFEVGKERKKREMLRVTRIYVSQRGTLWNGRKNWNIPKHLATFDFTTSPSGGTELALSPPGSTKPFLRLNLTPFKYVPAIPFSTNSAKWIGMDLRLAQPPLPSGEEAKKATEGEEGAGIDCLCGTSEWKVASPEIWGRAKGCWVDVDFEPSAAPSEETPLLAEAVEGGVKDEEKGHWPKYSPWKFGVFIENATMNFKDGEVEGVTK